MQPRASESAIKVRANDEGAATPRKIAPVWVSGENNKNAVAPCTKCASRSSSH